MANQKHPFPPYASQHDKEKPPGELVTYRGVLFSGQAEQAHALTGERQRLPPAREDAKGQSPKGPKPD